MTKRSMKFSESMSYGLGDMGINIGTGTFNLFFLYFLTTYAGLSTLQAGVIYFAERICSGLSGQYAGYRSDMKKSKRGRRRSFMADYAIPYGVLFVFLWAIPNLSNRGVFLYCLLFSLVYCTIQAFVTIPYNSLLPSISKDPAERTELASVKSALGFCGTLVAAVFTTFGLPYYEQVFNGTTKGIAASTGIEGILIIFCLLIAFFGTNENVTPKTVPDHIPLTEVIKNIWSREEARLVIPAFACNKVGVDVIMALYVYYLTYSLQMTASQANMLIALPLVTAILVAPLCSILGRRFGKFRLFIGSSLYLAAMLVFSLVLPAKMPVLTGIAAVLTGIGLSFTQILNFSILPDIIEVGDRELGMQWEGTFYGLAFMMHRLLSAVTVLGLCFILGTDNYISGDLSYVMTQHYQILDFRLLFGGGSLFFVLLAPYFIFRILITKNGDRFY